MQIFIILAVLGSGYAWASASSLFFTPAPMWVIFATGLLSFVALALAFASGTLVRVALGAATISVMGLWSHWLIRIMDTLVPSVLSFGFATPSDVILTYRIFTILPTITLLFVVLRTNYKIPSISIPGLAPRIGKEDIVVCRDMKTGHPVVIPGNDRYLNMLIVGPIGSGKSSRMLAPLAWQELKNIKWSMEAGTPRGLTLIEPKGDLTDKVAAMCRKLEIQYVYIDPLREGTARFNPLEGDAMTASEATRTVLRSMANKQGKQEPFFAAAQDNAARNIILLLKYTRGDKLSLPDVSLALRDVGSLQRDVQLLKAEVDQEYKTLTQLASQITQLCGREQQALRIEYDRKYATYFNKHNVVVYFEKEVFGKAAEKFFQFVTGLRQQLDELVGNKALFGVISPRIGTNGIPDYSSDINLDKHLATGGVLLVNTASNPLGHVGDAFGCYVLQHLQGAVFRRPGDERTRPRHTTIIDELSGYVGPNYERMLSNGRSYRCENIVALQNTAQLMLPGDRDFRERVMGLCRNKVFFGGMDGADAQYISREMGATNEIEHDYTLRDDGAKSTRETKRLKNRFTPTDLMEMTEYHVVYRTVKGNRPQLPGIGTTSLCEFDIRPEPSLFSKLRQYWDKRRLASIPLPLPACATGQLTATCDTQSPAPTSTTDAPTNGAATETAPTRIEQPQLFESPPPTNPQIEPYQAPPSKKRPRAQGHLSGHVTIFDGGHEHSTPRTDVADEQF